MYRENAIYFPYIVVPKSNWFVNILFYWDDVFSIVPAEVLRYPERLGFFMQALLTEELVKFAQPQHYFWKVDHFAEGFEQLLINNNIQKFPDLDKVRTFTIHMEKMGEVKSILFERGLCRDSSKRDGYGWLDVESKTASIFMGYLAMKLGFLPEFNADPITDKKKHFSGFLSIAERTPRQIRTPSIRQQILNEILPAPEISDIRDRNSVQTFIDKLKKFKIDHKEHLFKFRRKVEDEVFLIAKEQNSADRKELLERSIQRLKEDRDSIVDLISSNGWKVKLGKFLALLSFVDPSGALSKVKSALELGGLTESKIDTEKAYAVYAAQYQLMFSK
jgi:hypothetical protein